MSLIIIAGPSGVGKTTLVDLLIQRNPERFASCTSHTTRAPRPGERDGVDYHFTTREQMEQMIARNEFVEHAEYIDNLYGTSKHTLESLMRRGITPIMVKDMKGVASIRASSDIQARFLFIAPPSMKELKHRLCKRADLDESSMAKRLELAKQEMLKSKEPGLFDKHLINSDLESCYAELVEFCLSVL